MVKLVARFIQIFLAVLVVMGLTFLIVKSLPGSPIDTDSVTSNEVKSSLMNQYGLDVPSYKQLYYFYLNLMKFEFGESFLFPGQSVRRVLLQALPPSLFLGLLTWLMSLVGGIILALFKNSYNRIWLNWVLNTIVDGLLALPNFALAAILIYLFSIKWSILPSALWLGPKYYVLPVLVLGARPMCLIFRLLDEEIQQVVRADYITTARAKGVYGVRLWAWHILRNALSPLMGYLAPLTAGLLTGSFVVETIFAIPGVGTYLIESIGGRDYPLLMALTGLFAAILALSQWISEFLLILNFPQLTQSNDLSTFGNWGAFK